MLIYTCPFVLSRMVFSPYSTSLLNNIFHAHLYYLEHVYVRVCVCVCVCVCLSVCLSACARATSLKFCFKKVRGPAQATETLP